MRYIPTIPPINANIGFNLSNKFEATEFTISEEEFVRTFSKFVISVMFYLIK